jgi:predicted dinucleotide-binding enzyme
MQIGMLGAGHVAQAVAGHAVSAGHQVVLSNRRGPASLAPVVERLGPLASSREAKMLGESNRGGQNQSIVPVSVTSAAVCKSPMSP